MDQAIDLHKLIAMHTTDEMKFHVPRVWTDHWSVARGPPFRAYRREPHDDILPIQWSKEITNPGLNTGFFRSLRDFFLLPFGVGATFVPNDGAEVHVKHDEDDDIDAIIASSLSMKPIPIDNPGFNKFYLDFLKLSENNWDLKVILYVLGIMMDHHWNNFKRIVIDGGYL
ncbi:hypothetical protein FRB95_008265 [Tulasnella sp. JGI-2019a]|nr:hypothetical protein FRB93_011394 [Tulasnella sp. JGI-2019a]KAG9036681.1 hypothetical protein FRB95_008265 [Tulasnella sp. JGI-2019a]